MCFSAEASFAGSVIISAIGIATIRKVHNPSQIIFASIPLFFGVQQFAEGLVWMSLPNPDAVVIQKFATYLFLIMADFLWPMMIPLAVLFMEKNQKKRRILQGFAVAGILLSLYYAFCLLTYNIYPQISGYHIQYKTDFPKTLGLIAFAIYLIVTITPLFVSSIQRTHLLGALMFLSCLVTAIFFRQYLTSVWCFFAAIISGVIFWILSDSKKKFAFDKLNLLKAVPI
ncbi:MAG: hypothetical protein GZ094_11735 [Mariniphaga sp.]|nr:hypothetical protein [Mariniphaga sp.]